MYTATQHTDLPEELFVQACSFIICSRAYWLGLTTRRHGMENNGPVFDRRTSSLCTRQI